MDGRLCSRSHLDPSMMIPTTLTLRHHDDDDDDADVKLAGAKRSSNHNNTDYSGGKSDLARKRIKMRDLHSIRDPGIGIQISESSQRKEAFKYSETPQISKEPAIMISDVIHTGSTGQKTLSLFTDASCTSLGHVDNIPLSIDLNTKAFAITTLSDGTVREIDDSNKKSLFTKHNNNQLPKLDTLLDVNVKDVPNSVDPIYPFKTHNRVKSAEASECGSSTGPLEEKDSFRVWKEMKENGFLSSSHGGIPVPKQRGRKSKNDVLKKKMELAKREQVNRFTKVAAPSGLLNGLNPGIINHVRNSKQVHSIIEALVRSEKLENGSKCRPPSQSKIGTEEINGRRKDSGASQLSHSHEGKAPTTLSEIRHTTEYPMSLNINVVPLGSNHKGGHGDSNFGERRTSVATTGTSLLTSHCENEKLALNVSSPITMLSEITSTLSNEESANQASVSSLSVKAATIASQWLDLLCQDIKGRLAALRRSKKRVQAVIQTELPFLIAREFSSSQENTPYSSQSSPTGCPGTTTPDMHRARWTALFDQMDRTLSEEGNHLENWLNQVQEMQLRCERGLQCVNWYGMQLLGRPDDSSTKKERELAVRAAAASIYSTCNLVMAADDVSCT